MKNRKKEKQIGKEARLYKGITNNNNSMIRLNNRLDHLEERTNEVNVISLGISQKEVRMWERMRRSNTSNNSSKSYEFLGWESKDFKR